jgi:nucleotide-binding universal stress UspA family protein
MAILCGTDFSAESQQAVNVACGLAVRGGMPLHLVHALELGREPKNDGPSDRREGWAADELEKLAARARKLGATVEVRLKHGSADAVVLESAAELSPELVVIAAGGQALGVARGLGDHADRIVRSCRRPVLMVRDAKPFADWVAGVRPLKILLGADFSKTSEAMAGFLPCLRKFGPIEILAHHVYYPPQDLLRVGLSGVGTLDARAELSGTLRRDLAKHFARLLELGPLAVGAEPHLGSVGARLADAANEIGVDLLAVGSRDWGSLARRWEGSVTRTALASARISALCVHAPSKITQRSVPRPKCVLVATDFSPAANEAVTFAYSLLDPGGAVHLVHVLSGDLSSSSPEPVDAESLGSRLAELVPTDASELHKHTHTHVIVSEHTAEAICRAADELCADAVCLGTRGPTSPAGAPLGAVAAAVLAATKRPVLLVKERQE